MSRGGYPRLLLMLLWLRLCWSRMREAGLAQMFTVNKLKPQNRHDFSFGKQKRRLSPAVRVNLGLGEEEEGAAAAAARPIAPNLSQPLSTRSRGTCAFSCPSGSHSHPRAPWTAWWVCRVLLAGGLVAPP